VTATVAGPDKAHYYPDAKPVVLKLVADPTTRRLLGVQGVGPGEVVKRIDVAATALAGEMTVDQVANLDLAYAPPYSEAMDILIHGAQRGEEQDGRARARRDGGGVACGDQGRRRVVPARRADAG